MEMCQFLVQMQNHPLLLETFPHWHDRSLTLKEIEHALCEYQKYIKLQRNNGEGGAGSRLYKSKSNLDHHQPPQSSTYSQVCSGSDCGGCVSSSSGGVVDGATTTTTTPLLAYCDTCNTIYCNQCEESMFQTAPTTGTKKPPATICSRCSSFEAFRWNPNRI